MYATMPMINRLFRSFVFIFIVFLCDC